MRLTSEVWISALTRRVFGQGGFAAVLRRGATEAGAIFLILRGRSGAISLLGPAPQTAYDDGRPQERVFAEVLTSFDGEEVNARLERERRFDPDIWVVELETDGIEFDPPLYATTP